MKRATHFLAAAKDFKHQLVAFVLRCVCVCVAFGAQLQFAFHTFGTVLSLAAGKSH